MKNHIAGAAFSVLLHFGLVALLFVGANSVRLSAQKQPIAISLSVFAPPSSPPVSVPEPVMETVLQPITPKVRKPRPKPRSKPKPRPKPPKADPLPEPEPVPQPELMLEPRPVTPPISNPVTVTTPVPPPRVDSAGIRNIEDLYKASLTRAIDQGKHYPRRARRMRQQGEASISFTIERNGAVSKVRIEASSGSRILDEAALRAVQKIDGQLPFPDDIKRSHWSLTIPIHFILR